MAEPDFNKLREEDEQSLRQSIALTHKLIDALKEKARLDKNSITDARVGINVVKELQKVYSSLQNSASKRYKSSLLSKEVDKQLEQLAKKRDAIEQSSLKTMRDQAAAENKKLSLIKGTLATQIKAYEAEKNNFNSLRLDKANYTRRKQLGVKLTEDEIKAEQKLDKLITKSSNRITEFQHKHLYQKMRSAESEIRNNKQIQSSYALINKNLNVQEQNLIRVSTQAKAYEQAVKDAQERERQRTIEVNKQGGNMLKGFKVISQVLTKIGANKLNDILGIDKAISLTQRWAKIQLAQGKNVTGIQILGTFFSSLGKNISKAFAPAALLSSFISSIIEMSIDLDKQMSEFARTMGISRDESRNMYNNMTSLAATSGDLYINTEDIANATGKIASNLGLSFTNATLTNKATANNIKDFAILSKRAQISDEALMSMYKTSVVTGKTLKEQTNEFVGQTRYLSTQKGLHLNNKKLLEQTSQTSSAIKLSLSGSSSALATAMVNAKSLGLELSKVEDIASSLLSFESSIQAELEAELLTNREFNLERARTAALQNDLATVAEEVSKNIGNSAEFAKMNRIQQEAIAKAVGMSREELAGSLLEREALYALSEEEAKQGKQIIQDLTKRYGVEKAIQMYKDQGLNNLLEQQSIQERINASLDKLKNILLPIAKIILDIVEPISMILEGIAIGIGAFSSLGKYITNLIGPLGTVGKIFKDLLSLATALTVTIGIMTGMISGGASIAIALASAAAITALLSGMETKANDYVDPGYGERKIISPEGTISLNNKDSIIAGTNLGGNDIRQSNDSQMLINEIKQMRQEMTSILNDIRNKEGVIYMDGEKVAKGLVMTNRRIS